VNGVLIIDKPAGLTSHDVVSRSRRILRERSIGHLGTLDPMATGVLPLVVGNFTRLAQFYLRSEKTYEGTIRFGFATDTYDADGDPTSTPTDVSLKKEIVDAAAAKFRGLIQQVPPPFSAKKIKGVPAYKLARKQKEVVLQPVQVEIKELEIASVDGDRACFRARVASGTYMRSIAHDMGQLLGCGGHLQSLRRTAASEFVLEDAHTLDEIAAAAGKHDATHNLPSTCRERASTRNSLASSCNAAKTRNGIFSSPEETPATLADFFIHPRKLLPEFPSVTVDDATAARIRAGRSVNLPDLSRAPRVKVFIGQTNLIAVATRVAGTLFHPKIVLCTS